MKKDKEGNNKDDVELSFKAVKDEDEYMNKYGIPKHEVEYCYSTLKQAEKIKSNKKKMAAIKELASEEIDVAEDMIENLDDFYDEKHKKANGGKEVYVDEGKNNYDTNREDYVDED